MCPDTGVIFNDEQGQSSPGYATRQADLQMTLLFPVQQMLSVYCPRPGTTLLLAKSMSNPSICILMFLLTSRPLSSTSATIILNEDDSLYAVLGGSGGSRIFPAVAQVILNLECGLDISAAIERPRVHNQLLPLEVTIEVGPEGSDKALVADLEAKGHKVQEFDINLGIAESES